MSPSQSASAPYPQSVCPNAVNLHTQFGECYNAYRHQREIVVGDNHPLFYSKIFGSDRGQSI
jgi:hypothetical protein